MQTILVTGAAGFIGANFIEYFLSTTKNIHVVNLDALTYAGDLSNLAHIKHHSNYTFEKGDIYDRRLIEKLFEINIKREDFEQPFLSYLVLVVDSGTSWFESNNKDAFNKLFNN